MKYVVVLGDGMADRPVPVLGGKTPLQCAKKPHIDSLAARGELGLVRTVPEGMHPGSDVANLAVMGYDPARYYTGRSPLEAISMGLELGEADVAMRCNLVCLSEDEDYADKTMVDYSADEIPTGEAAVLIAEVQKRLGRGPFSFHPGVSYRHCMIWKGGAVGLGLTPPHDISLRKVGPYLPPGQRGSGFLRMMRESYAFLKEHPANIDREARGLRPANSIWLWGEGTKPAIPSFLEKYGLSGSVISAVDLVKGLGIAAGMRSVEVDGATGNIHTNFGGKASAALRELESGRDFVYIHVEAPDECGHRGEIENKVRSIELIDEKIVGPLLSGLEALGDYSLLVMPDHPTPLETMTHGSDPVPFLIYRRSAGGAASAPASPPGYDEFSAAASGLRVEAGYALMDRFLGRASTA